jgi:hypothetical protein
MIKACLAREGEHYMFVTGLVLNECGKIIDFKVGMYPSMVKCYIDYRFNDLVSTFKDYSFKLV